MYKLYNDNCFNILNLIENESIDMILCDLPYNETGNKWDKQFNNRVMKLLSSYI